MRGLSLVAASGGHSSSRCAGLSLLQSLLLRSTSSRHAGSVVVAYGPSCSVACGIFPDQGSNPCPLHRQADSQPLRHQGSPLLQILISSMFLNLSALCVTPFNCQVTGHSFAYYVYSACSCILFWFFFVYFHPFSSLPTCLIPTPPCAHSPPLYSSPPSCLQTMRERLSWFGFSYLTMWMCMCWTRFLSMPVCSHPPPLPPSRMGLTHCRLFSLCQFPAARPRGYLNEMVSS